MSISEGASYRIVADLGWNSMKRDSRGGGAFATCAGGGPDAGTMRAGAKPTPSLHKSGYVARLACCRYLRGDCP